MTTSWAPFKRASFAIDIPGRRTRVRTEPIELAVASTSTFRVTADSQLGVAIYALQGQLDSVTADQARDMLSAVHEEPLVLLDLKDITKVDLEGVAVLRDV